MTAPARAKVFNDSPWTHREKFNGAWVEIPAQGSVEMDFYKAHEFKGQYFPIELNKDGRPKAESAKRIRVVGVSDSEPAKVEKAKPVCQACKYQASSDADLEEHTDAMHLDALADAEIADKRRKAKKSA